MASCTFADQSKRYDRKYPGGYVPAPYRGVLHSTEGLSLPSYQGGAVAPHFTVDPRTGHIWQHFDTARPSRSLQHIGSVETNNAHAIQIEIIAFSDATLAAKYHGLRVDQLTPAQLAPVEKLMRWIEATCGVHRSSGLTFKAYPGSAGYSNGIRLSASGWAGFRGWCGHSHVPQNDHGDPSDIAIAALLAATTGGSMTIRTSVNGFTGPQQLGPSWSGPLRIGTLADGKTAALSMAGGPGWCDGTVSVYFTGGKIRVRAIICTLNPATGAYDPTGSAGSVDLDGTPGVSVCKSYPVGVALAPNQRLRFEAHTLDGSPATIDTLGAHCAVIS